MAEGPYLMGIDHGTGGSRVGLFDRDGSPVLFHAVELARAGGQGLGAVAAGVHADIPTAAAHMVTRNGPSSPIPSAMPSTGSSSIATRRPTTG
jgi:ribulose kinase